MNDEDIVVRSRWMHTCGHWCDWIIPIPSSMATQTLEDKEHLIEYAKQRTKLFATVPCPWCGGEIGERAKAPQEEKRISMTVQGEKWLVEQAPAEELKPEKQPQKPPNKKDRTRAESQIPPSGKFDCLAASYPTEADSKAVYQRLDPAMRQGHNLDLTITRMLNRARWTVVLIVDKNHTHCIKHEAMEIMLTHGGNMTELESPVVKELVHRRLSRTAGADRSKRYQFEHHGPEFIETGSSFASEAEAEAHFAEIVRAYGNDPNTIFFDVTDDLRTEVSNHLNQMPLAEKKRVAKMPPKEQQRYIEEVVDRIMDEASARLGQPIIDRSGFHKPATRALVPFLIDFLDTRSLSMLEKIDKTGGSLALPTSDGISLEDAAKNLYRLMMKRADAWQMTPSAMAVFDAVFDWPKPRPVNNLVFPENVEKHCWIELQNPISYQDHQIKAVCLTKAYPKQELDAAVPFTRYPYVHTTLNRIFEKVAGEWVLAVIDTSCRIVYSYTYVQGISAWVFPPTYTCPYGTCSLSPATMGSGAKGTTLIPCKRCRNENWFWSNWFKCAWDITQRKYATRPNPPEYPIEVQEYETVEQAEVGKGNNARFVKQMKKHEVSYRLVKFDIDVLPEPHTRATPDTAGREKKQNWLSQHDLAQRIYEQKTIAATQRVYRLPYFRPLVEACRHGLRNSPDGEEYELVEQPGHEPYVVGHIREHARWQPFLRPEYRKATTIKKVIASKHL